MLKTVFIPFWARKPKHNKTVIATERGWVVEETGEILSSHKNLLNRLKELGLDQVDQDKKKLMDELDAMSKDMNAILDVPAVSLDEPWPFPKSPEPETTAPVKVRAKPGPKPGTKKKAVKKTTAAKKKPGPKPKPKA